MAKAYYWNPRIYSAASSIWRQQVQRASSGGTVFSGNVANTSNNDLFSDTFAVNDAIYFGQSVSTGGRDGRKWRDLWFNASGVGGLNMSGTYTGVWEYYNGSWTTLTVTDGTSNFSAITGGETSVSFTPPNDWKPVAVNGQKGFWIRYRLTSVTSASEGGHLTTYIHQGVGALMWTGSTSGTDDVTMNDLYQWAEVSGPSAPLGIIVPLETSKTSGARAYLCKCHLSPGVATTISRTNSGGAITAAGGFFNDKNLDLHFENYYVFTPTHANAITTFGNELYSNEYGNQGVNIHLNIIVADTRMDYDFLGACYIYNSDFIVVENDTAVVANVGASISYYMSALSYASKYLNCTFQGFEFIDLGSSSSGYKKHIYFLKCYQPQLGGGGTINDITTYYCTSGYGLFTLVGDQVVSNLNVIAPQSYAIGSYSWNNTCDLINPNMTEINNISPNRISWSVGSGKVRIQFLVDVHVQDESGNALQNAFVIMKPDSTASVTTLEENNNFSVTTNSSGDISQQTLTQLKLVSSNPAGSSVTSIISNYGPFVMTITKPGFKTIVFRKLTINSAANSLRGAEFTVVMPKENINFASDVIQIGGALS